MAAAPPVPLTAARAEELRAIISRLTFTFAKTMPETPHFYTVRRPENEVDYLTLFEAIQAHGQRSRFGKRWYRYLHPGDGYRYWAMTSAVGQSWIINRARVDEP
jgi:hypothetical protein